jgi:uncharacterized protein DUF6502
VANQQDQGAALLDALELILRPLMPLFLNYGVSHQELSHTLGRVFVYAIAEQLKAQGRPTTIPRLAILTSINRGLVEKYLQERAAAADRRQRITAAVNTPSIVLATWHEDGRFATPYGAPLDLDLDPAARRSFSGLVANVAPGQDWEAVLDQLQASGCVEVINNQFVRCTSRVFIPSGVSTEQIGRIGKMLGALASTMTHNILLAEKEVKYIERQVESEYRVSIDGQRALRGYLETAIPPVFDQLDRWFTAETTQNESASGNRIGVSLFMFDIADESVAHAGLKAIG